MISMLIANIPGQISPLGEGEKMAGDIFDSDLMFILLIIPLVLLAIVSLFDKYPALRLIKAFFSNSRAHTLFRTLTSGTQIIPLIYSIIGLLSLSTFCLFAEFHYNLIFFDFNAVQLFFFNILVIIGGILIRYLFCSITEVFSRSGDLFKEYFYNITRSYMLLGIVLLFTNFLIRYLDIIPDNYLIITTFISIGVLYFVRIVRLVSIFIKRSFSLFYLIVYLCTLEFAPVLIFVKYLSGQI